MKPFTRVLTLSPPPALTRTVLAGVLLVGAPLTMAALSGSALAACAETGMPPAMFTAYAQDIQRQLAEHGYDAGTADGKPGTRTRTAIRAYQRDAGLPVDGCVSRELAEHLNFAQPKVYARGKTTGLSTGGISLERQVQEELTRHGYYSGPVDGRPGPMTRRAVRTFQRDAGLSETGQIDSQLLDALRKAPNR